MSEEFNFETSDPQLLKCINCGSELKFNPETKLLHCESCGAENQIDSIKPNSKADNFLNALEDLNKEAECENIETLNCNSCGAEILFDNHTTAGHCSFCLSHLNITEKKSLKKIKPSGILPFEIKENLAVEKFNNWTKNQWLAPNDFFNVAKKTESLIGIYIPYWQFEANTFSYFVGEVRKSDSDGTDTSYKVDGKLNYRFENILICGSLSLPEKQVSGLEPWNIDKLVKYDKQYIKGFNAEVYSLDLNKAFEKSKILIEDKLIEHLDKVRAKNNQHSMTVIKLETDFREVKFKHILLPIWVSSFQYKSKIYRFVINGQTGEVQGERPYSKLKTLFFVIGWFIALAGILASVIFLNFILAIVGVTLSILLFNLLYYIAKKSFNLKGKRSRILETKTIK